MKKSNTLKFFNCLRKNGSQTKYDIQNKTGLSWASVSNICAELSEKGFLSLEKLKSSGGRPAELISISDRVLSLGIDINSTGVAYAVINLGGKVVFSQYEQFSYQNKSEALKHILAETKKILKKHPCFAVNIAMQGKIDKIKKISVLSSITADWTNVDLEKVFADSFQLPVFVYHDPDALIRYEIEYCKPIKNLNNGSVIRADNGIGIAIISNGRIHNLTKGSNCEFGQLVISNGDCLEQYSSLLGMAKLFNSKQRGDFIQAYKNGSVFAKKIVQEAADYFRTALLNLITLTAPEFVVLYGNLFELIPDFFDKATSFTSNDDCKVILADYNHDVAAIGASLLSIDECLEDILCLQERTYADSPL